jgi:hypothetical protein
MKDEFGADVAVIIVKHSLDPGVKGDTVQYETVREKKSAFVNMYHASVKKGGRQLLGVNMGRNYW